MLSRLFKRSPWPIGLELGERRVRLLQCAGLRSSWRVQALAERPLAGEPAVDEPAYHQAVAEAVASVMAEGQFTGHALISTPPTSVVQVKNLRLPIMPAAELNEAVLWEANDRLKLDRTTHEIRFFNAGEVRQGTEARQEVILLAVPRAFIEAHVEAMAALGLTVATIDAPMSALARAVCEQDSVSVEPTKAALPVAPHHPEPRQASDARLIVEVGEHDTQVIIARQRQIAFFKLIDFGLAALRDTWQGAGLTVDDLAMPGEQAVTAADAAVGDLTRELVLCLRYYSVTFRGDRPTQATLTGAGALPWLAERLGEQASLSVQCTSLLAEDTTARTAPGGAAAWSTACGLALHTQAGQAATGRAA